MLVEGDVLGVVLGVVLGAKLVVVVVEVLVLGEKEEGVALVAEKVAIKCSKTAFNLCSVYGLRI